MKPHHYITVEIQKGKNKPQKFKHYIKMPLSLYDELCNKGIIDYCDYIVDPAAFFEFKPDEAIINFISLYQCEDLHRKIDHYLVMKAFGVYPLKRGGIFF
jgi:hypothetical protein